MCAFELEAFIPSTAKKIYSQLNINDVTFETLEFGKVAEYKVVEKPEILFARIDEEELKNKLAAEDEPEIKHKAEIEFPDFDKVELRVGEVIKCEKHPEAPNSQKCASLRMTQ